MNRFLTNPKFETLPGVKLADNPFALTEPLIYRTDALKDTKQLFMPEGFRFNLASIPKFIRWLYSVAGWYRNPSIPHDFLCFPCDLDLKPIPHICSSDEAADLWFEALLNAINQMTLTPRQYKKKLRTVRILEWAVRTGGPKFEAGDTWAKPVEEVKTTPSEGKNDENT